MKTCLILALLTVPTSGWTAPSHDGHEHHGHGQKEEGGLEELALALVEDFEARPPILPQTLVYEFAHSRRNTIDFFPMFVREEQGGVQLGVMPLSQRRATYALLQGILSQEGFLRVHAIRGLEDELRADGLDGSLRLSDAYTARFFGRPGSDTPWAFKFEGHHLSLNATVIDGVVRGTPLFLGSNPAEVRIGPNAGMRVLAPQEDLARALLATLTDAQGARARIAEFAPEKNIPLGPLREVETPAGLPASEMTAEQRTLLLRTISSYASNLRPLFATEELRRIESAGIDSLHFLWRGGTEPGAECSYLIQGPTVFIQFDAIEGRAGAGANHIHCIWRDPERDFGKDLLTRHYEEEHGDR
jgi:hypothetical protein